MELRSQILIGIAILIAVIIVGFFLTKRRNKKARIAKIRELEREVLKSNVPRIYLHITHKGEGPVKGYVSRAINILINYSIEPHILCLVEENVFGNQLLEANLAECEFPPVFHAGDGYVFAATVVGGRENGYDNSRVTLDYKIYKVSNNRLTIVTADCFNEEWTQGHVNAFDSAFRIAMRDLAIRIHDSFHSC